MRERPRYGFPAALLVALTAWTPAAAQEGSEDLVAYLTGTWDVRVTFTLPDGSEGTGSASCEAVPIMDGAFLQQEYRSTFGGEPLVIRQFLGYDDQRRGYVQFQLHAGGGAPTQTRHLAGSVSGNGKTLTLAGDSFDSFSGEPVGIRTVTRILDRDHYVVEEWFGPPTRPEELKVLLHHTREARPTG